MRYRTLGRSALKVSEIILGTMNFGSMISREDSFAIMDHAVDLGVNVFDTANQYGGGLGVGGTESIVGEWLAANRSKRDRLIVATKVYEPMSADVNDRGLSARHIVAACEASLRRLQVDCIDLYQMHHVDRAAPPEEIWQAMDRLIAAGKILYVGSSNFPGWKIAQLNERSAGRGRLGLVSEQSLYNLIERRAELEVLPACEAYGLGLIAWSPLAGGLLAGAAGESAGRRQTDSVRAGAAQHRERLAALAEISRNAGLAPADVALAWVLARPGVTAAIAGPRTREQLRAAAAVVDAPLPAEVLKALDDIFPPVGPAPEAYAW
jgi:aryl-alcohol dehydrogenase-like predicted oxidoreductase